MRRRLDEDKLAEEQEDASGDRDLTEEETRLAKLGRSQLGRFNYQEPLAKKVKAYCEATGKDFSLVFGAVTRGNAYQNDAERRIGQIAQAYHDWAERNL